MFQNLASISRRLVTSPLLIIWSILKYHLLPPQGFRPEAKSRGGTLVACAYIKDSTYSTNMQSVYRKNLDLLEQGPRGIGR